MSESQSPHGRLPVWKHPWLAPDQKVELKKRYATTYVALFSGSALVFLAYFLEPTAWGGSISMPKFLALQAAGFGLLVAAGILGVRASSFYRGLQAQHDSQQAG